MPPRLASSRLRAALLGAGGLLGACTTADPLPPLPMGGATSPAGCSTDLSCPANQVCVGGECVPGQCNIDRACPPGQTCDPASYTCSGSTAAPCNNDDNCLTGRCLNNLCQDVECVVDEHCADGTRCEANRCVTAAGCQDVDRDGYGPGCAEGPDCDDSNAMVNPGVREDGAALCDDGVDNDCSGADAVCGAEDVDGDGFEEKDGDCDDANPNVNPGRMEVYYNDLDDDCNPRTNDDDQDGDGFAAERSMGPDCDDQNPMVNPVAMDTPGNGVDEDCDGADRVLSGGDADGDGVTEAAGDCNDNNPNVSPRATEVPYNGVDDDCSANTPDNDLDRDGFAMPRDCDDANPNINPNAEEVYYNGVDEDCDPSTADGDADGDGVNATRVGGRDCNDDLATVNPNAMEVTYNGVDDDCNPATRDDDLDADGFGRNEDCDDMNAAVNPGVVENASTNCGDGIDHNCVGGDVACQAGVNDRDGDGVPDAADCAPTNPAIPGPFEISNNGVDDDCDPNTPDACDDDAYDDVPNNAPGTASVVTDGNTRGVQYNGLVLCPGDDDWFQITVPAGDGVEVDVAFTHADGDIDVALMRRNGGRLTEEGLTQVDSSAGTGDLETLYQPRASAADTYFIKVFHYGEDRNVRQPYSVTINVFQRCTDDPVSASGEHNDARAEAKALPAPSATRQLCDYDDDWYTFEVTRTGQHQVDAIFTHANGDVDVVVEGPTGSRVGSGVSFSDDEKVTFTASVTGTYAVRVYGVGAAKNSYRVFKSSGTQVTKTASQNDDRAIPDATSATASGVLTTPALAFTGVPAGSIVRSLKVKQLDINHGCLSDLKVELLWDGAVVATVWNRDGVDCLDNQLDDDSALSLSCAAGVAAAGWNFRAGNDICFLDRTYREFAGLDAQGDFQVRVTDAVRNETGSVVNLELEMQYLQP